MNVNDQHICVEGEVPVLDRPVRSLRAHPREFLGIPGGNALVRSEVLRSMVVVL